MSKDTISLAVALVAVLIAIVALFTPIAKQGFGADGDSNFTNLVASGDITAGDDLFVTDDATITDDFGISGGTLNIATTNSATSTVVVGCKQSYATSTATPVRELYTLAAQNVATSTHQGVTSNGVVVWAYGACPNL